MWPAAAAGVVLGVEPLPVQGLARGGEVELAGLRHQEFDEVESGLAPARELGKVALGERALVLHRDDADGVGHVSL